jgi:hypothetical protein
MNPLMNCLKITKSFPSFNSIPFSSPLSRMISHSSKRKSISTKKALREMSEKQARISCLGTIYPSPAMTLTRVAGWDSFFCRFRLGLRMISGAIDTRSRETGWYNPLMQRNQRLEEWLLVMCKSCGKKCLSIMYPINFFI